MESQIYQDWIKEERAEAIKQGIKQGIKEGETRKALETAKAALKEGSSVEFVVKITGLDRETVLKLKAELN